MDRCDYSCFSKELLQSIILRGYWLTAELTMVPPCGDGAGNLLDVLCSIDDVHTPYSETTAEGSGTAVVVSKTA